MDYFYCSSFYHLYPTVCYGDVSVMLHGKPMYGYQFCSLQITGPPPATVATDCCLPTTHLFITMISRLQAVARVTFDMSNISFKPNTFLIQVKINLDIFMKPLLAKTFETKIVRNLQLCQEVNDQNTYWSQAISY